MAQTMLESDVFETAFPQVAAAAQTEPVFVEDHGEPVLVILGIEQYRLLRAADATASGVVMDPRDSAKPFQSLADLFNIPGLTEEAAEIAFARPEYRMREIDIS